MEVKQAFHLSYCARTLPERSVTSRRDSCRPSTLCCSCCSRRRCSSSCCNRVRLSSCLAARLALSTCSNRWASPQTLSQVTRVAVLQSCGAAPKLSCFGATPQQCTSKSGAKRTARSLQHWTSRQYPAQERAHTCPAVGPLLSRSKTRAIAGWCTWAAANHGDSQNNLVVLLFEAMHLLLQGLVVIVPKACSRT